MLKKYIQDIVKSELAKQKLNSIYGLSRSYNLNKVNDEERQQFNKQISQLNDEKFKLNQQLFNSYGDRYELQVLKQENQELKESLEKQKHEEELEKLKKENEMLKESIEKIDGKLILKSNLLSEQKEENKNLQGIVTNKERIAKELNSMLNKEKRKNKELKQENEILEIKSSEYYNKFLSEGIKKEKAQELIRLIEKEIDLQGFDQDDFYSPEQTYWRIKKIIKES